MNKPQLKRILHIPRRFSQDEWGGTEAVISNICQIQAQQGLQPEIHTSLALSKNRSDNLHGIPIHRYSYCYPFFGLSKEDKIQLDKKGGNLLSWSLYRALRKAKGVRIYHAHVTKRTGASVLKAAQLAHRPCIVTLHGNMFDVPKMEATNVVAPQEGKFEWGRAFGAYFGSRSMLQNVDAILCVGYSEYEKASVALGAERVHFLPNGVFPERFKSTPEERMFTREKLGTQKDEFLFGCISRIDPQKNQQLLIQSFSRLAASNPKVKLLLCGPITNQSYFNELVETKNSSGFGDRILILPPVEPDSKEHRGLFAALDAFVLPSRHEPFGIVILEAWSAGKPVIAANIGGLSRLVNDGTTGIQFNCDDGESLLNAMQKLLEEKDFQQTSVKNAQKQIEQCYTWPQIAQQLENIYQQVEQKYD